VRAADAAPRPLGDPGLPALIVNAPARSGNDTGRATPETRTNAIEPRGNSMKLGHLFAVSSLAIGITGTTLVGLETAAHATLYAHYQGNLAWTNGSTEIWVTDAEADGHGVHAEYITRKGGRFTVGDPNGSAAPSGYEHSEDGSVIETWRVCETACGDWVG